MNLALENAMNNLKILLSNKSISLILTLTFFMTLLSYIILPFFAIFTLEKEAISISHIGLIIGTQSLSTSVCGLFGGAFEKKIGTKKLLCFSMITIGICYILYTYAQSLLGSLLIVFLLGAASGVQGPVMKSILARSKSTTITSDFLFRFRYTIFCVAVILGPLISQLFYLQFEMSQLFIITGGLQLLMGIVFFIAYKESSENDSDAEKIKRKTFQYLDKKIIFSCLTGIISFAVFSIFTSATPLAFNEYTDRIAAVFTVLIILNSVIALIIQPIIIKIVEKIKLKQVFYIGSVMFCLAYFIFSYSSGIFVILILGTIVFTVGEAFLIPSIDVLVDSISNKENKTAYFSIAEFKQLGFFIGPLLSGVLIDHFNPSIMYIFFGLLSLTICLVINIFPLDS